MEDDREPIKMSENLVELVRDWLDSDDGSVGVCLVCGERIHSEADLIPGTNDHRCLSRV
jgi:hypothetical protein